ncbi:DUF2797 domain-containing protein [Nocardia pseudovaccinii]|uniref:DUF2797 domain-containing protein n=1 Tax=Nocardia pseudovaccinii TaxID=189540 RepID=UPI000A0692A5|nr:DUF2797 domain-containing protein [Nocardia pseudovaccinii]
MLRGPFLYCGLSWREDGQWFHEAISPDGTIEYWPGQNKRLAFRVTDESRYCLGYFTFANRIGTRQPCAERAMAKTSKQCDRCRFLEGFSTVHQHQGSIDGLPAQIRDYITQPHLLYIACFGTGQCKVGTAALSRKNSRLHEQGAILARVVASSPDGLHVRHLERIVSAAGFKQAMTSSAKTNALTGTPDRWSTLEGSLATAAAKAIESLPPDTKILYDTWTGGEWFYNKLLDYGRFLEAAPSFGGAGEYVIDGVDALGHTILCHDGDGSPELVVVNDSKFVGHLVELDDTIENKPSSAQTSLF